MPTPRVHFYWNGSLIAAYEGDTVASALWRAGITTLARSRKQHRPLGLSGAWLAGVLARVDGTPNVRLDQVLVREGLRVTQQNTWPSPRFDVLRLAQALPARTLYGGFEHGAWMPRSGLAYRFAERLLAQLAGVARPMAHQPTNNSAPAGVPGQRLTVDCLVVGAGPAGLAAANHHAAQGARVALVGRGAQPARFARAMGLTAPGLDARVQWFGDTELCGVYRNGRLLLAAPHDTTRGAVVFAPQRVVLAGGRRSMPPLVPGNTLPGVLDAHAALALAAVHNVVPGQRIAVVGSAAQDAVSKRLQQLGATVVHCGPVKALRNIVGRQRVRAIDVATGSAKSAERRIDCDALVHAGPWRADPSLTFQASAEGLYQLLAQPLPAHFGLAGACAQPDETIVLTRPVHSDTLVCACMDVTVGELQHHRQRGETHPEVLKRLTACGMGTCQGYPCWELMQALLAAHGTATNTAPARPSHRPPRRAISVAQAAGLDGLVEPDR